MMFDKAWANRKVVYGMAFMMMSWAGMSACGAQVLQIGTSVVAPYTTPERQGFLDQLVKTTFSEAGVQAEVLVYPQASERSLMQANQGADDGQALRIGGLDQLYPNLVQVPEPVMNNDFVVMIRRGAPYEGQGWGALKDKSVAYILGWKIFETNVPAQAEQTRVRDAAQLFSLLQAGRVDAVLYERWQGLQEARNIGLAVELREPPLASVPMFMYLHKKHADLVPGIAQALVRLKQDGRYRRIQAQTLKP